MALTIRKKSAKVWKHSDSFGDFILSKLYCKTNGDNFQVVEAGGAKRGEYHYSTITVYDDTDAGTPETFTSAQALMLRLEALNYVGFRNDGDSVATLQDITDNGDTTSNIVSSSDGTGEATLYPNGDVGSLNYGTEKSLLLVQGEELNFSSGVHTTSIIAADPTGIGKLKIPDLGNSTRNAIISITKGGITYYADANGNISLP